MLLYIPWIFYENKFNPPPPPYFPPPLTPPPPPQNSLTSLWLLAVIAVIGVGAVIGFRFLRRKRMLPPHLQVDSEAVNVEAERLMHRDFFRSIREQLAKKRDTGEGEKNG